MANEFKVKNGLIVSGSADFEQDLRVRGILTVDELHTSITSASVLFESGSTVFGNDVEDIHQFTGSLDISGSISLNGQAIGTGKLDETTFYSFTSSYISDSGSFDDRLDDLESFSSSLDASFLSETEFGSYTSSANNRLGALETASGSIRSDFNTFTSSYTTGAFTGSFIGDGSNLYNIPASGVTGLNLTQIADGAVTASVSNANGLRVNSKTEITGSLIVTNGITGSIDYSNITNKPTLVSGSIQIDITGTTGYSTFSSSIASTDLAQSGRLSALEGVTGSYATTGSNTFDGDQIIQGFLQFNPETITIDGSLSASYIHADSNNDGIYFTQNYNGLSSNTELKWIEGNLYTGLLYGGVISATTGGTTFNISAGKGIIVNLNATTSSAPQPTTIEVSWNAFTGQTITNIASAIQTFLGIDSSGAIIQQTTPFTSGQFNSAISLGTVLHQNLSTVNGSTNYPNVAYGYKQRTYDFVKAFGPLKLSGLELAVSGSATGSLIVGSGTAYAEGRNYNVDPNNPSFITDSGTNISKIFRYHQVSGTTFVQDTNGGAGYTTVDASQYNNSGTLTTVPDNEWTTQRVFWFPNSSTKAILVYYGNRTYTTSAEAIANLPYEAFTEVANTQQNAVYLGALVLKKGADFTNGATYQILPGGLFRNLGGTGGGGTVVTNRLSDLSDVDVVSSTNGQLFVYNAGLDKWYGSSNITASLFGNASTATKLQSVRTINGTSFDGTQDIVIPNLVSGSSQITYSGLTGIPSGILSGSSQIIYSGLTGTPSGIVSGSSQVSFGGISGVPSGLVSGSSQVLNGTTIHSGSFFNGITVVSGSSQVSFGGISGVPSGLVSGSSQVLNGTTIHSGSFFNGITVVSGSAQISFSGIAGVPSGLVSGSSQITFGSVSGIPSGLVSGSSQITLSSTSGFGSYLNQAVLTTSSPTFDSPVISGVVSMNTSSSRNKYNVYGSGASEYTIGMQSAITYGGLNDWGMTFQFNNDDGRGFWWGDAGHTTAQGAMALTTNGNLTVARRIRVGYGETDTTTPTIPLQVYGSGGTILDIQGASGQLFSVSDDLTGDIFSVSDISGMPLLNVNTTTGTGFGYTAFPLVNNLYDLGTSALRWANVYTNDLHLSNEGKVGGNDIDGTTGDWTIQEGAEKLYIINNKNGKKYKIDLTEVE